MNAQLKLDYAPPPPPVMTIDVNPDSQEGRVLAHLKRGERLTGLKALDLYGCIHLPSIIYRLKKLIKNQRMTIKDRMVAVSDGKKHVKEYWLEIEGAQ